MMVLGAAALTVGNAAAAPEQLSESDRAALLKKLDVIKEDNEAKVEARFRAANSAYRQAMSSGSEAVKFYLDCVKKVNFDDQNKSFREFREWRDRQDAKLSAQEFRRALQYQLRWLSLTLKAASSDGPTTELSNEAADIIADIFADGEKLEGQVGVLQQGVNGTFFARAYKLNGIQVEKWPMSPLPLARVFDEVILPPLRNRASVERLHRAWESRIDYEAQVVKVLSSSLRQKNESKSREEKDREELAYEKFLTEQRPELVWQMEVDCFKAGDQREAARRMFRHLTKNLTHTRAPEWEKEFRQLITPKATVSDKPAASGDSAGDEKPVASVGRNVVADKKAAGEAIEDNRMFDVPEGGLDPFMVR
ncbi:hypothetical protein [Sulfuriroseicoccus oceanibius]|uniref:Uncharacterized protein n=1 Tax=Sulfuriroseicoccus oceanibius TaxID=2707525 RepID=A0A6B3L2A4_9BACT|nr:hypothetical protein [Sulfuriroseicoccus oceanibius]QQL43833.1 hypothetical protein G3M56_007970 [Sulfuriroseicoccus oceanibius]